MKSVQRYHLSCFVVLLLCLTVVPAVAAQYRYQEQKGKEITAVTVTREKQGNLLRTEISKNDVTTVSFNDPGGFGATSHAQWVRPRCTLPRR